ncbi:tail fiber domain-containing protein [Dyadobacter fermentans]|uniref:tail fiber domain-containing protein n=1 Tax=Dyadobacter fermentans TaxID=94254 RepID=UPI001CBFD596|nr:tail fiber domain-containing protein [Dyadobacter fermentans]MBZ1359388.1 tail fiber domain-containing protein [Dyadobacter fermentans]
MKQLVTHLSGYFKTATTPMPLSSKAFPRRPKVIFVILLSVSLLLLFKPQSANAQAPQQFSFQGVARDATGKIVTNTPVSVRVKIHKDGPNGEVVFSETQVVTTSSSGIFDLVIGGLVGGLGNVNWASDNCFIQTEIDLTGGANFVDIGSTQLKSVPYALASRQWVNNIPIVQTGVINSGPILSQGTAGANLIWYPRKAAFRTGQFTETSLLEDAQMGDNSFGAGTNVSATGESSIAIGRGLYAKSRGSVVMGLYNNDTDSEGAPSLTDRIFQLGNGTSANRSNAVTILRNGNFGIGNNVIQPEYLLDLGGRMRVRHNGATAGIHFNNSQNVPEGFVGMINDNEVGFFIGGAWRFVVNKSGTVYANEFFTTSDKNLKSDLKRIGNSLSKLKMLNGYNYHWKDKKNDKSLQTGLVAQEVEVYFPNLVSTKEDGYKAVNYTGLIPHLIEAVKELDKKTEEIAALKKELASVQEMNKKLSALEASVKELLAGKTATSTQTSK